MSCKLGRSVGRDPGTESSKAPQHYEWTAYILIGNLHPHVVAPVRWATEGSLKNSYSFPTKNIKEKKIKKDLQKIIKKEKSQKKTF